MEITWKDYEYWLKTQITSRDFFNTTQKIPPLPSQWSTDSRTIEPGQWFIPLKGPHFDGHQYIPEILKKGASGFLYQKDFALSSEIKSLGICVSSPLKCYQLIAMGWRKSLLDLKLLAITGSNGKTTTKELLGKILRNQGSTLATESNFNNEIGVPKTLLSLTKEHRFAVLEFGARFPGNIRELMDIGSPDITCLLNAGMAHIGIFGSVENLRNTKLEIFRDLKSRGTQIVPYDDPIILNESRKLENKMITFGVHPLSDVQLKDIKVDATNLKIHFQICYKKKIYPVAMNSLHKILSINSTAAFAMGLACGIAPEEIVLGLQNFSGVKGRFQISHFPDFDIIDDSYNANPQSMVAGIESLKSLNPQRPLIVIVGDMLELGDLTEEEHRRIGKLFAQLNPHKLFFVGEYSLYLKEGAQEARIDTARIHTFQNVADLIASMGQSGKLWDSSQPVIYVKGSRGVRLDQVIDYFKKHK